MKKYCWIILIFIAQNGFSQYQSNSKDVGKEIIKNGECFAKCLVETYQIQEETYPVFTGEKKQRGVRLKTKTLILKPAITKWEKKKTNIKSNSSDPNDCLVWCLVEMVPGETASINYVKNTSKTTEFENQTFTIYQKKASKYEVVQKVCNANIDESLLNAVNDKLSDEGYQSNSEIRKDITSTLNQFQRDNSLPIGQFDYLTLRKLDVPSNLFLK